METKESYNTSALIKIKLVLEEPMFHIKWREERKCFLCKKQEAGLYSLSMFEWDVKYTGDLNDIDGFLKDKIVYRKPHVILYFAGDYSKVLYYDSEGAAKNAYNDLVKTFSLDYIRLWEL